MSKVYCANCKYYQGVWCNATGEDYTQKKKNRLFDCEFYVEMRERKLEREIEETEKRIKELEEGIEKIRNEDYEVKFY